MVYRMTMWDRIRSRLRGTRPPAADAADAGVSHLPASAAPFETWSNLLLHDRTMLVVTEEGVFQRERTGQWIIHANTYQARFGRELPDLLLFLEQQTFNTYKHRIQEINHQ